MSENLPFFGHLIHRSNILSARRGDTIFMHAAITCGPGVIHVGFAAYSVASLAILALPRNINPFYSAGYADSLISYALRHIPAVQVSGL